MGRTYRGLSKKDRENLKRNRLQRHKREVREDDDQQFNRKKDGGRRQDNVDRNLSDDEYYRGYEE